jgi:hypothetical protein
VWPRVEELSRVIALHMVRLKSCWDASQHLERSGVTLAQKLSEDKLVSQVDGRPLATLR